MPEVAYALKRCSICNAEKPLDQFAKDKSRRDGRMIRCLDCDNARCKRYYHGDKFPNCICCGARTDGKRYCGATCQELHAWERRGKPIIIAECKQCSGSFLRLSINRDVYCTAECKRAHRSACNSNKQNKRRTAERHSDITVQDERRIRRAKRCALCSRHLTQKEGPRKGHLDHIVPIHAGGTHTHGNVRMLCRTCNLTRPNDGSDITVPVTLWAQDIRAVPMLQADEERRRQARDIREAQRQVQRAERAAERVAQANQKRHRLTRAIAMRESGHPWKAIAEALGYSSTGAVYSAVTCATGTRPRGIGHQAWSG